MLCYSYTPYLRLLSSYGYPLNIFQIPYYVNKYNVVYCLMLSVTEREVRHGIINAPDVEEHCLAYIRHIKSMNLQVIHIGIKQRQRNFIL